MGESDAELVEVDGVGVGVGGGEAVAGVVAEAEEVSEVVRVYVTWVC